MEQNSTRFASKWSVKQYAAEIDAALREIPSENDRENAARYLCGVAQGLSMAAQTKREKTA